MYNHMDIIYNRQRGSERKLKAYRVHFLAYRVHFLASSLTEFISSLIEFISSLIEFISSLIEFISLLTLNGKLTSMARTPMGP